MQISGLTRIFLLIAAAASIIGGCSTARPVPLASLATPGAVVETLSSSVTVSLRTSERHISARGMLVYRRPDQLRLVMLSPLGTTVMDTLVNGEQITIAYPSEGVAFAGKISELPSSVGKEGWELMRWVLESDLPKDAPENGMFERRSARGTTEKVTVKNGLIIEKSLPRGEVVRYRNHAVLSGVLLPMEVQMENADGGKVKLNLEEPDVNMPIEELAFRVALDGLRLYPISALKSN